MCAFLFNFLFSQSAFKFYSKYVIMSYAALNISIKQEVLKIRKLFVKNERIESNYSQKRAPHFDKRALLSDKRALR